MVWKIAHYISNQVMQLLSQSYTKENCKEKWDKFDCNLLLGTQETPRPSKHRFLQYEKHIFVVIWTMKLTMRKLLKNAKNITYTGSMDPRSCSDRIGTWHY